jgi:hypothetical protein
MKPTISGLSGRVLMSLGTAIAGCVPLLVDPSPTHPLNPAWPAHAGLHAVWLLATGALLALICRYLIWFYRHRPRRGINMGSVLGSVLLGGLFIASATSSLYGGVLADPVTAPMTPNQDLMPGMPLNRFAFGLAWLPLLVGSVIARSATPAPIPG